MQYKFCVYVLFCGLVEMVRLFVVVRMTHFVPFVTSKIQIELWSGGSAMAFFVFFSAAAGAGIVSADFGFVEFDGFDFLFRVGGLAGFVLGGELFHAGMLGV